MNSLRMRIAALLILAIVTVVALATLTASVILRRPGPEAAINLAAQQIKLMIDIGELDRLPNTIILPIQSNAGSGIPEREMTRLLSAALVNLDISRETIVTRQSSETALVSVKLAEGRWLVVTFPSLAPPPGALSGLLAWVSLIVLGSTAISLYAAAKITKPLAVIEGAVSSIDAKGEMRAIPETGPVEVRTTAEALNRLSKSLKLAMESRMRLVAAAGHDLRTPMTRMRLRAEFLPDDTGREKWLADLEELDHIADSAISLVREEIDGVTELVDLGIMLEDIVEGLSETSLPVQLLRKENVLVRGGTISLRRSLTNLIMNAATHGGGARVSIVRAGCHAVIWIEDSGPGIPEPLLSHVFEPFFRVDAARKKTFPGAGLGMAIAKEIIERLGGVVEVQNIMPTGLKQTVKLPLHSSS